VCSAAVMLVLTLFSTFISAVTISSIIRLLVYMATCAALPALRSRTGAPPAAFTVAGGPVIAVLACILSVWLLTNSTPHEVQLVAVATVAGLLIKGGQSLSARGKGRGARGEGQLNAH
jgi:amino acid transporter